MSEMKLSEYLKLSKAAQELAQAEILQKEKEKISQAKLKKIPEVKKLIADVKSLNKGLDVEVTFKTNMFFNFDDQRMDFDEYRFDISESNVSKTQEYKDLDKKASLIYKEITRLAKKLKIDEEELSELVLW